MRRFDLTACWPVQSARPIERFPLSYSLNRFDMKIASLAMSCPPDGYRSACARDRPKRRRGFLKTGSQHPDHALKTGYPGFVCRAAADNDAACSTPLRLEQKRARPAVFPIRPCASGPIRYHPLKSDKRSGDRMSGRGNKLGLDMSDHQHATRRSGERWVCGMGYIGRRCSSAWASRG